MSKTSPSETYGTIAHFKKYRWKDLNKRTINGMQSKRLNRSNNSGYKKLAIQLKLSREEFYTFCDANYQIILDIYRSGDIPSIDRINPDGHYELNNIRIVPLSQNRPRKRLLASESL